MADIFLKRGGEPAATYVPNIFIDEYMAQANGEFVKIYLYLLRCMGDTGGAPLSISDMADRFDHTEKDVKRALKYWEKMHLLRLEFNEKEELAGICLLDSPAMHDAPDEPGPKPRTTDADPSQAAPAREAETARREYTPDELMQFEEDDAVQELLFVAERYLGHTLNNTEIQTILYWFDRLHFSQDLIESLIEQCVAKGHSSVRYMDKIALSWAEQDIHTLAQANEESDRHSSAVHTVIRSFGISGRNLVDYELAYVRKWAGEMGFSDEIIASACQRTIRSAHRISFEYADTILGSWKKQNVCSLKDIELLDAQYQEAQKNAAGKTASRRTAKGTTVNRFSGFPQRTYDFEELEKELLTR